MKKSLIALAALAATASFAQSTVTISGNIDFAAANNGGSQIEAKGSTVSTTVGTSSTSVLRFIAVEDLGGGMRATAQYNFDPRTIANDSTALTHSADTNATKSTLTGLARDEVFVGLSGGFGNVRLGAPNSIGLGSHGVSSPLGTGIGGGYTGAGTSGTMTNSYVQTRYNRSVRWDSPAMNGFTVSALYAPGNDAVEIANTVAVVIPNARQATEFGVSYSQGPMNVSYAYVAQGAQVNKTGYYSGAQTDAAQQKKTSVSMINANYKIGATTLYVGWNNGNRLSAASSTDGSAVDTSGSRVAVKHDIGAVSLMAQYTQQKANSGTNGAEVKSSVTGLRADYALSKRTVAYAGYEKWDTGTTYAAGATTSLATGDRTITSVGLRHSF